MASFLPSKKSEILIVDLESSDLSTLFKIANWLEHYAEAMELNVWTSSTVINSTQDPTTKLWSVTVKQQNGKERVFKVKHLILALGFRGEGYIPSFPGKV